MRARLWLLVMDMAEALGWEALWQWALVRAAAATDFGEGAKCGEKTPW